MKLNRMDVTLAELDRDLLENQNVDVRENVVCEG